MDVTCSQCLGQFKIPDEKLPHEQVFAVGCPRCKNKITIDTRSHGEPASVQSLAKLATRSVDPENYELTDRAFDFIEPSTKTALICESESTIRTALSNELGSLGYYAIDASSAAIALKKMRFHIFNVMVINDSFNAPRPDVHIILEYLGGLLMEVRRNMFVILLSNQFRTTDNLSAFNKNVNLIINNKNLNEFSKIFTHGLADYQLFYHIFQESLTKTGKG
ncbi:MAG: zinc-ribbon domain-containing protein [Desulfatirhabdiaceae bacterium]